ncbi:helix-turn-helix domain-containing protein [Streptomyces sp. NPDC059002]
MRARRERMGWTQYDVSERIGCCASSISKWENGRVKPRPHNELLWMIALM